MCLEMESLLYKLFTCSLPFFPHSAQVGLFWECPNLLVPGKPDDAYMDSSTTVYLEDSSSRITLGIQNPRSSNFRMQIAFNSKCLKIETWVNNNYCF